MHLVGTTVTTESAVCTSRDPRSLLPTEMLPKGKKRPLPEDNEEQFGWAYDGRDNGKRRRKGWLIFPVVWGPYLTIASSKHMITVSVA